MHFRQRFIVLRYPCVSLESVSIAPADIASTTTIHARNESPLSREVGLLHLVCRLPLLKNVPFDSHEFLSSLFIALEQPVFP